MDTGYLHWKADVLTEFDPFEIGINRFVPMTNSDIVGKAALEQRHMHPRRKRLVTRLVAARDRPPSPLLQFCGAMR